ncbi:hypothetical protein OSB04_015308 [Centaurea solstitialis]|uniref:PGG domain-containing protein n=1 Tax=Centaurea solstitialis TaxID=347529 RepID=A0AA38SYY4_9ASTR|nr:hypothetical protein OSB04_015308 [Centaurea solstitialis]
MALSSTSNMLNVVLEENPYPYPSHVFAPNFVTVKLSDRDEYDMWKTQMLCLLKSHGMLAFINNNFIPTGGDEKFWRRSDALVKGWILGSLSKEASLCLLHGFVSVADDLITAKQMWDKLTEMYTYTPQQHAWVAVSDDHLKDEELAAIQKQLYVAVEHQRWKEIDSILKTKQVKLTDSISINGNTALHVAVACHTKKNRFLERMLELAAVADHQIHQRLDGVRNSDGSTLLHVAASLGNTEAAEMLVKKDRRLLFAEDNEGCTPLDIQHRSDDPKTTTKTYLCLLDHHESADLEQPPDQERLLIDAITCKDFELACTLVEDRCKVLNKNDDRVLMAIAQHFPLLKYFKKRAQSRMFAGELLKKVCRLIRDSSTSCNHYDYSEPIFEAVKRDASEFVQHVVFWFPNSIRSVDKDGHNIAQAALKHRSLKVMALITHGQCAKHTNISENAKASKDPFGNNLLHFAARLAPANKLSRISGAALQIRFELQWFKLAKHLLPLCIKEENHVGETAEMVFSREHKELASQGERWLKETANSGLVTATLLTTITFAAAITVPGGNDDKDGKPIFAGDLIFSLFALSDALSMLTSAMSLLLFMSIFTSPFEENDFTSHLHLRIVSAYATLFMSAVFMIAAFGATLVLVFGKTNPEMILIIPLTWLPISCFLLYLNSLMQLAPSFAIPLYQRLGLVGRILI